MKTTIGRLKELIKEEAGQRGRTYPATAEEYAKQLAADAEARGGQLFLTTDPEHWAERDVHTGEDLAKYLAKATYWDAYKEAYGVRPRGVDLDVMSIEELEDEIEKLYAYAAEEAAAEEEWERQQRVPEPAEFQTPPLTHSPFAALRK